MNRADKQHVHILVVDDEQSMCEFLSILLKRQGFGVRSATSASAGLALMEKDIFDLVITDLSMPEIDGIQFLQKVKALSPDTAVIMMTAYATPETAISAMKEGAYDYITKPFNNDAIRLTIEKCIEKSHLQRENILLKRQLKVENRFGNLVGSSAAMKQVYELIQVVRNNRSNVLITGESGTGKELVAREIHSVGEFSDRPFVTVNCGAIPETLMESELFGHVRGAFTGATSSRAGLFRTADGGTLFLDEIGELTLAMQVKLLRVLQTKTVRPVGGTEDGSVDVRIIAATNRDLERMVRDGTFREDLFFRLDVIHIRVPPLRERMDDLQMLVEAILARICEDLGKDLRRVSSEALEVLAGYAYPGNIRELENILERSVALEKTQVLLPESLPEHLRVAKGAGARSEGDPRVDFPEGGIRLEEYLERMERELIRQALEQAKGTKTEAARLLGLSFRSFRYRLQKLGLE